MKLKHAVIILSLTFASIVSAFAQSTVWSKPDTTPPADPRARFRDTPPLMVNTNNWKLMVDIGTNVTFSGEVTAATNVSLANITGASPLPVFMPTNIVSGTITVSNSSLAVTLPSITAAEPLAVFMPTNTVSGTITVSNASIAVTGGVTNVGGYTLVGNAAVDVDTTAAGIAADDVLAPAVTVANAVRTTGGSGILQSLTWIHGGTLADPAVKPAITLLVCSGEITWPATNAACTLVQTEIATNLLGIVQFSTNDFVKAGTNQVATKTCLGIGIKPAATTLYFYSINAAATTNSKPSRMAWTILQD